MGGGESMINSIILQEIRQNYVAIQNNPQNLSHAQNVLIDTIMQIVDYSRVASTFGIIALEKKISEDSKDGVKVHLLDLIELVVDNQEPLLIEEIGIGRYYVAGYQEIDALQYLIYLVGILSIQAGDKPIITEKRLLSLVSLDIQRMYHKKVEEELNRFGIHIQKKHLGIKPKEQIIQELCQSETINITAEIPGYFHVAFLDYLICNLDEQALQCFLNEIQNSDIASSMVFLSGTGIKRILKQFPFGTDARLLHYYFVFKDHIRFDNTQCRYEYDRFNCLQSVETMLKTLFVLKQSGRLAIPDELLLSCLHEMFVVHPANYRQAWNDARQRKFQREIDKFFDEYGEYFESEDSEQTEEVLHISDSLNVEHTEALN